MLLLGKIRKRQLLSKIGQDLKVLLLYTKNVLVFSGLVRFEIYAYPGVFSMMFVVEKSNILKKISFYLIIFACAFILWQLPVRSADVGIAALIKAGSRPSALAIDPVANKVYVANTGAGSVTVINGATHITRTVMVGIHPVAIAVNPVTQKIYVVNRDSNNVTVINGKEHTAQTVTVGSHPVAVAVNPITNLTSPH